MLSKEKHDGKGGGAASSRINSKDSETISTKAHSTQHSKHSKHSKHSDAIF